MRRVNRKSRLRRNKSKRFEIKITSKFAIVLIGLLIMLQIFTAIQTSSSGAVLAELEQKELELIRQNQELANSVVDQNSLISIREKADNLGYHSPQATFYITEQETVALLK